MKTGSFMNCRGRKDKGSPELRNKFLIVNNRKKFATLSEMGRKMMVRRLLEKMELSEDNFNKIYNDLKEKKKRSR